MGIALLAATAACDRTPDYVLKKSDMVDLLVDIHKAEGVIELNRSKYGTDSMRKVMKQSVLLRHGITQEQFDTSLVWYGHNIEKYIEVYDDVIERLEKENSEIEVGDGAERVNVAVVGDSADAWPGAQLYRFFYGQPSSMLRFNLRRDNENWEEGDKYTWRFFLSKVQTPLYYSLAAQYADGTTDYISGLSTAQGWNEFELQLDSARVAQIVYGYVSLTPMRTEVAYLDSITLVRTRFASDRYSRALIKTYDPENRLKGDDEE
jgi:hypothetical protein